jgi:hypothetical protein
VSPAGQTNAFAQPTAKPRLVAKSGSGLGTVPRSSLSKLNGAGSGPDASKVWNKNQREHSFDKNKPLCSSACANLP